MTDKQIIIDGVDVSGCSCHYNGWSQLYRDNRDMCDKGYDLECKPKENGCYHYTKCLEEQLKRSEAQCEGMFVTHTDLEKKYKAKEQECSFNTLKIIALQEALEQYETENEELKKQRQADKGLITSTGKMNYQLLQEYDKLKTALTEIKEIAECLITTTDEYDSCYYKDKCSKCEVKEDCQYLKVEQILQKISEMEDV